MKKLVLFIFILCICFNLSAQDNLIKSGGFEDIPSRYKAHYFQKDSALLRCSNFFDKNTRNDAPIAEIVDVEAGIWYKKTPPTNYINVIVSKDKPASGVNSLKLNILANSSNQEYYKWFNTCVFQLLENVDGNKTYIVKLKIRKDTVSNNKAEKVVVAFGTNSNQKKIFINNIVLKNNDAWNDYEVKFNLPLLIEQHNNQNPDKLIFPDDFNESAFVSVGLITSYNNGKTLLSSIFVDDMQMCDFKRKK